MAEIPVVHLPERDYADEAARRDWRKQGFAVTALFNNHPVLQPCPLCTAERQETAPEPAGDSVLADLVTELACMVHPAAEAGVRAQAARIFRYGMMRGWDKAVAAGPADQPDPLPDAMREHHG